MLAHEVGHHLNGHNFAETDPSKRKLLELEADQFSGSVLRSLGASLAEARAGIDVFGLENESATHPAKAARREAIANGWKRKDEQLRKTAALPDDGRALAVRLTTETALFEDRLKNIVKFLPRAERLFEYPDVAREYSGYVRAYNAARDSLLTHRAVNTADFNTRFAHDESARLALADWYKTALDDIHERFLLVLDRQVQQWFSDVEKEKISPGKARRAFRQNWSSESALFQNLRGRVDDLEKARERLAIYLKL